MSDFQGKFVWYELMTTDLAAAGSFYAQAVGWTVEPSPHATFEYYVARAGEHGVAGLMGLPEGVTAPHWAGYVAVRDIVSSAAQLESLGGQIRKPISEIPDVGQFAVVADPQGSAFLLFQPGGTEGDVSPPPGTVGHCGWHELIATNIEQVIPFYNALFGWQLKGGVDMGPLGTYHFLAQSDGTVIGGAMNRSEHMPYSVWKYYFNVDSATRVEAFTKEQNGVILQGPVEVPGGSWIVNARDPQGAVFCVVSAGK